MRYRPGDRVLIIQDCRDGSPATGQHGVYEGDKPWGIWLVGPADEDGRCAVGPEYHHDDYESGAVELRHVLRDDPDFVKQCRVTGMAFTPAKDIWPVQQEGDGPPGELFAVPHLNPRIRLDDGSVIWGIECWWRSLEEEPAYDMEEEVASLEEYKSFLREFAARCADQEGSSEERGDDRADRVRSRPA